MLCAESDEQAVIVHQLQLTSAEKVDIGSAAVACQGQALDESTA
jgi:hypothetical protein